MLLRQKHVAKSQQLASHIRAISRLAKQLTSVQHSLRTPYYLTDLTIDNAPFHSVHSAFRLEPNAGQRSHDSFSLCNAKLEAFHG